MTDINEKESAYQGRANKGDHVQGGLLLLLIGAVLLARPLGAPLPAWLFSWPVIVIIVGLFMGVKLRFRTGVWMIPVFIGSIFLIDRALPQINLKPFVFPLIVMLAGILFIFKPKKRRWQNCGLEGRRFNRFHPTANTMEAPPFLADRSDFIDATAIFGGVKKIVLSKNFQGGDITNVMGGSEINLSQADFKGRIYIDTTNVFGGTKLIIPPQWDVQSNVVAIFGGVDDKRKINGTAMDLDKVVVIEGTCLFGGIEIRSY